MSRVSGGLPPLELQDFEPGAEAELTVDSGQVEPVANEQPGGEPGGGADLEAVREEVRQNALATRLLADPNIQAYLAALQSGRQVRIAPVEQEQPGAGGGQPQREEEIPDPEDWEALNNQQLFDITSKKTARLVQGQVRDAMNEIVGPLMQQIQSLQQPIEEFAKDRTTREIEAVEAKYPDFKKLGPDIMDLHKKHPTLSVEDLYHLAKSKKVATAPADAGRRGTASERPTGLRPAPKPAAPPVDPRLKGRAGMTAILENHFRSGGSRW